MKDPSGLIRTWLFGVLDTNVSYNGSVVPVYSFTSKDAAMPYILIGQQAGVSEMDYSTKSSWVTPQSVTIEIYTSNTGNDASYVSLNTISDSVIQLIRTRAAIVIAGFNVVSCVVDSIITDTINFETNIVLVKIINITLIIEEV